jgi:hypothetical protein
MSFGVSGADALMLAAFVAGLSSASVLTRAGALAVDSRTVTMENKGEHDYFLSKVYHWMGPTGSNLVPTGNRRGAGR